VLLALLVGLAPAAVLADVELTGDIGAATIRVEGEVTGVQYDGYSVYCNHDGYALVSVFDAVEHGSLTIQGDVSGVEVVTAVDSEANDTELTWDEFCDIYGEMPPAPPDGTNTDVWVDPFKAPIASRATTEDSEGPSIADMNAEAFLDSIDWTGQDTWLWT
jgi:hypothetical protein